MPNYLLPQNQTELEASIATATEFRVSPDAISKLWDAADCPVKFLPWLAWALSVDFWDDTWSEDKKRATIAGSIAWHRKKGTPWAVKQVLASIGYDRSEIIEHRQLYQSWIDAGGEVLNGGNNLDGNSDLSAPNASFRFVTTNWAEYAVRLNVGDIEWLNGRQREAIEICRAYAPARSHLIALIIAAFYEFDSRISMYGEAYRYSLTLNNCQRIVVTSLDTIDGCSLIGGDWIADCLDGQSDLSEYGILIDGVKATGDPLDSGQIDHSYRYRINLGVFHAGGGYVQSGWLDSPCTLDGETMVAGDTLNGYGALSDGDLSYPTLISTEDYLDGTETLGFVDAPHGINFTGFSSYKVGSTIIREPL